MSLFLLNMEDTKVVFCHVPKTGGTSIRQGMKYQASEYELFDIPTEWAGLPSFGFVRDPFNRIVSVWQGFTFTRKLSKLNFRDFVTWFNREGGEDKIADPCTIEHHAAPMSHLVHGLGKVNWIGQFEHLARDFNRFRNGLGLDPVKLPKLRKSNPLREINRTKENIELVVKYYEADYELCKRLGYGYSY